MSKVIPRTGLKQKEGQNFCLLSFGIVSIWLTGDKRVECDFVIRLEESSDILVFRNCMPNKPRYYLALSFSLAPLAAVTIVACTPI
jgi:hypothetical protein